MISGRADVDQTSVINETRLVSNPRNDIGDFIPEAVRPVSTERMHPIRIGSNNMIDEA